MADLYIQNSSYSLSISDRKLMIKNQERTMLKAISLGLIDNILIFGNPQLSTQLLKSLSRHGIPVFYFSLNALKLLVRALNLPKAYQKL